MNVGSGSNPRSLFHSAACWNEARPFIAVREHAGASGKTNPEQPGVVRGKRRVSRCAHISIWVPSSTTRLGES